MFSKKRSKELKFLLSFLLLAGWAFQSCTDEGIIDAPTWHQTVEHGDNALVRDAKAMVDGHTGELVYARHVQDIGQDADTCGQFRTADIGIGKFYIGLGSGTEFV